MADINSPIFEKLRNSTVIFFPMFKRFDFQNRPKLNKKARKIKMASNYIFTTFDWSATYQETFELFPMQKSIKLLSGNLRWRHNIKWHPKPKKSYFCCKMAKNLRILKIWLVPVPLRLNIYNPKWCRKLIKPIFGKNRLYKTVYPFTDTTFFFNRQTVTCFSPLWLFLNFIINGGNIQDGVW
jgi:hypothetical protein